ncbi:MAG: autotransporter outer membrane beta-barrel domain-containing protein [Burkholderiaceae bacterium]|nr:autotransporter outer membrane beta-barrel domain-containing protein [Burkholderiaceae bacterium]
MKKKMSAAIARCRRSTPTCAAVLLLFLVDESQAQITIGPGNVTTTTSVAAGTTTTVVGNTNITVPAANAINVNSGGTLLLDSTAGPTPGQVNITTGGSGIGLNSTGGNIQSSGQLVLQSAGGHAVLASGAGSNITLNGGVNIGTIGTGSGLIGLSGGQIDATNVSINNTGASSGYGAVAESGSSIRLHGTTNIATTGTSSIVLGASASGSLLDVTSAATITGGARSTGIYMLNGGQVGLRSGSVINMQGIGAVGMMVDNTSSTLGSGITINLNGAGAGNGSTGVVVTRGASLGAQNLTIQGANATLGVMVNAGSNLSLTGTNLIRISQSQNAGWYTSSSGYLVTASGAMYTGFTSTATSTRAGLATSGGTIYSSGTTIEVSPSNGYGVWANATASGSATVTLDNNAITTTGNASYGLKATTNAAGANVAQITANNTQIQSSGGGGAMIIESFAGEASITLNNSIVRATGASTSGLVSSNNSAANTNRFNMSGGELSSASGDAIEAYGGLLVATIGDGARVSSPANLLYVANGAQAQLTASGNSVLTGDVRVSGVAVNLGTRIGDCFEESAGPLVGGPCAVYAAPAAGAPTADLTLLSGTTWTGASLGATNVTVNNATWNVTANSLITQALTNAGTVAFTPYAGAYRTLTTNNYIGQGGSLGLNTYLATDGSPSDLLVINGGTASGTSSLLINNTGPGAVTTGNGIQVIKNLAGGTTATSAFHLGRAAVAGPYEYELHRGALDGSDPDGWYLRTRQNDCAMPGAPCPAPYIRPEISVYTAIAPSALLYSSTLLDTLDERIGRSEGPSPQTGLAAGDADKKDRNVWGRLLGMRGSRNGDVRGIYGYGPSYDYSFQGIQVGTDLYRKPREDGHRDQAGIYGAIGYAKTNVIHYDQTQAGNNRFTGYSIGGYWTHMSAEDAYVDLIGQVTKYDVKASSQRGLPDMKTNGLGWAVSGEIGKPIRMEKDWIVEPQGQLVYQSLHLDDAIDAGSTLQFSNMDSLQGRLGVRIAKDTKGKEEATGGGVRFSVWREFRGNPVTSISTASGYLPFRADMGGSWWEIKAGMTSKRSKRTYLYGNIGYQQTFDKAAYAWDAKIGMRMDW